MAQAATVFLAAVARLPQLSWQYWGMWWRASAIHWEEAEGYGTRSCLRSSDRESKSLGGTHAWNIHIAQIQVRKHGLGANWLEYFLGRWTNYVKEFDLWQIFTEQPQAQYHRIFSKSSYVSEFVPSFGDFGWLPRNSRWNLKRYYINHRLRSLAAYRRALKCNHVIRLL